jgi:Kef-type K+ transport system membrane component KefB
MNKIKNTLFYIFVVGTLSAVVYNIAQKGTQVLQNGLTIEQVKTTDASNWMNFAGTVASNATHSVPILLTQIVIIIAAARLLSWVCKRMAQPMVIGEILAGIALGPSLVGAYFPEFTAFFFPPESLGNLNLVSQIGLILFMFVVGMELDFEIFNKKASEALVISHTGIIIPFTMGFGLAYYLYPNYSPEGVAFIPFALFLSIAVCIAAFPVMARIVQERGLYKQKIGSLVITSAAIDDITAWCLLATIIAIVKAGSFLSALYTIGAAVLFVLVMFFIVRPFLKRIGELHNTPESLSKSIVSIFFIVVILAAWVAELIGIHVLFGAFIAGVIMPQDKKIRYIFIQKVEDVALVLFLPLFFVYTGLRTEIGLLNNIDQWKTAGVIFLVATTGKFFGTMFAARFVGQNWRDSLIIGSLMNTRGLMELVALNIGLELGVLTPEVFAMLVIMALLTTFMTGPLLSLIDVIFKQKSTTKRIANNKFDILVSFANPEAGKALLRLADSFLKKQPASVSLLHVSPENTLYHYNLEEYEDESFKPVIQEADELGRPITTLFKVSGDIDAEIIEMSNNGNYDLLMVSMGQSIFEGSLLGKVLGYTTRIINPENFLKKVTGKEKLFAGASPFDDRTQQILQKAAIPVGVFMGKPFKSATYVVLILNQLSDSYLLKYAELLLRNNNSFISIYDPNHITRRSSLLHNQIVELQEIFNKKVVILKDKKLNPAWLSSQDLVLVGLDSWKVSLANDEDWVEHKTSMLVIKN